MQRLNAELSEQSSLVSLESRRFLHQNVFLLLFTVAGAALILWLPVLYFSVGNYDLFYKLAYDKYPQFIQHLERELVWIIVFGCISISTLLGLTVLIGYRLTLHILDPIKKIEKHMRHLAEGQWFDFDIRDSQDDSYRGLLLNYEYLVKSLKANTEREIKILERLSIDPMNKEAYRNWTQLLENKRGLLNPMTQAPQPVWSGLKRDKINKAKEQQGQDELEKLKQLENTPNITNIANAANADNTENTEKAPSEKVKKVS